MPLSPQFLDPSDSIGFGDFRVDFAATYNDFFKFTERIHPIAIVGFGNGPGWAIEDNFPPYFFDMFELDQIPSEIGVIREYAIPKMLKQKITYHSTLPKIEIANSVNALELKTIHAYVNESGDAGNYLCGFLGYLEGWYHLQHSDPLDPNYNAMTGFIHVSTAQTDEAPIATETTLKEVIKALTQLP